MAGTLTVKMYAALTDLGRVSPLNTTYTVSSVDEYNYQYCELAATTAMTIDVGTVNTVDVVVIYLVSGGSTKSTGLDIHLASSTWSDQDYNLALVSGEIIVFRPILSTLSMKNLNSSTATIEYAVFGQNS